MEDKAAGDTTYISPEEFSPGSNPEFQTRVPRMEQHIQAADSLPLGLSVLWQNIQVYVQWHSGGSGKVILGGKAQDIPAELWNIIM